MKWRREDYGYAAVTIGAVVLVGYVIAGNFGLVPSPLAAGRNSALPQPDVAVLTVARSAPNSTLPAPRIAAAPTQGPTTHTPKAPHPSFGMPKVAISTASGTQVGTTDKGKV